MVFLRKDGFLVIVSSYRTMRVLASVIRVYNSVLAVGYSEEDGETDLIFTCGGEPYNPLEAGDRDELSTKLVTNLAKRNGHSFQEGRNPFRLTR
jgi:hypothetical protein